MDESVTDESYQGLLNSLFDESLLNAPILKEVTQTFYYIDTKSNYESNSTNGNLIGFTEYRSEIENNIKDGQGVVKVTVKEDANVFMSSKSELTEEEIEDLKKRGYDLVAITKGDQIEYIVLNDKVIEEKEYLTQEESSSNYSKMEAEYKEAKDAITTSMLATLSGQQSDSKEAEEERKKQEAKQKAAEAEARKKREEYENGKQNLEDRMRILNLLDDDAVIADEEVDSAVEAVSNADVNPDPGFLSRSILKINDVSGLLQSLRANISGFSVDASLEIKNTDFIEPSKEFVNKLISEDGAGNITGSVSGYATKLKKFRDMLMSMNPDWELYENINALSNLTEFGEAEGLTDVELANQASEYSDRIQKMIRLKNTQKEIAREEMWTRNGNGINRNKKVLLYDPDIYNQYNEAYDFAKQAKEYYNATAFNRVAYESIIEDKNLTEEEKAFYLRNEGNYKDLVTDYSNGKFKMLAYDHIVNEVPLTSEQQEFYDKWTNDDVVQEYSVYKYCLIDSDLKSDPKKVTAAQKAFYDGYTSQFNEYAENLNEEILNQYDNVIATGVKVPSNTKYDSDNPYLSDSHYRCEVKLTAEEIQVETERIREEKAKAAGVDKSEITVAEDEIPKTKTVEVYNPYSLATDMDRFVIATWANNGANESQATADRIKAKRQERIDAIGDINIHAYGYDYQNCLFKDTYKTDYGMFYEEATSSIKLLKQNISSLKYHIEGYETMTVELNGEQKEDLENSKDLIVSFEYDLAKLEEKIDLVNPNGTYGLQIYENESKAFKFRLIQNQCQFASIMAKPEVERTFEEKDYINVGYPQFIYSFENFHLSRQYELAVWNEAETEVMYLDQMLNEYSIDVTKRSCLDKNDTNNIFEYPKGTTSIDTLYLNYAESIKGKRQIEDRIDANSDKSYNYTIYLHDFDEKYKPRIAKVSLKTEGTKRVVTCYDENGNVIEDMTEQELALYYVLNNEDIPDEWYITGYYNGAYGTQANFASGLYFHTKDGYTNIYDKLEEGYNSLNLLNDTEIKAKILSYSRTNADEAKEKLARMGFKNIDDAKKFVGRYNEGKIKNQELRAKQASEYLGIIEKFNSEYNYFVEFGKKTEGKKIAQEWLDADKSRFHVAMRSLWRGLCQFGHGIACLFGGADTYTTPEDYALSYYTDGLVSSFGSHGELVKGMSEILTSIGNMGIPMLIGIAGQICNYFCPPLGVALTWASTALMGLSAGGNAYEQALKQGMKGWQAVGYGVLVGLSEAILERFLGGIPGLSNLEKFANLGGVQGFLAKMISEAIEESVQEMLDPVFKFAMTGEWEGIDWGNVLKSGLYGAITAGIMNGGTAIVNSSVSLMLTGTTTGLNTILAHYQDGKLAGNVDVFKAQLQEFKALSKSDPGFTNTKAQITGNPAFEQNYREYSDSWDAYKDQLQERYDAIKDDKSMSKEAKQIKKQLESMNETGKLSSDQFIEQLLAESIMNKVSAEQANTGEGTNLSIAEIANIKKILGFNGDITKISDYVALQMIADLKLNAQRLAVTQTEVSVNPEIEYEPGVYTNEAGETINISEIVDTQALVTEVNNMLNTEKITMGEVVAALGELSIEQINALIANSESLAQTDVGKFVTQAMKIYTQGLEYASNKYQSFFENFRDHGFKHSLEVTKYALSKASGAGLNSVQTSLLAFAALSHDFGMQGGEVVFDSKTCKSMAKNCSPDVIEAFAEKMFDGAELTSFIEGLNKIDKSDPQAVQKYLESKITGKAINLDVLQNILTKNKLSDSTKLMSGFEFVSSFVRSQHPLNSALDIIENADIIPTEVQSYLESLLANPAVIKELGDKGITIDSTENLAANVLAILAMTHSKSTSGISMFNVVSQWNDCINKLEVAAEERGIKINKSALQAMINSETIFNELVNYATWIRDGDAMSIVVSPDGKFYTIMQDGGIGVLYDSKARVTGSEDSLYLYEDKLSKKTYRLSKDENGQFFYLDSNGDRVTITDTSKIKTFNLYNIDVDGKTYRVNKNSKGEYFYTDADGNTHTITDTSKIYAAKYEEACQFLTETVTYEDGRPTRTVNNAYSVGIHASELYVSHDSTYTYDHGKISGYEATATVRVADAMPTIAFHDIVERLGEVNTYTNIADRSFIIKLPAGTDSVTAMMYMQEVAKWASQASKEFTTKIDGMLASGKITAEQHAQLLESQMKFYNNIKVDVPGANYSIAYNTGVNACTVVVNADVVAKINAETDIVAKMKALSDAIPENIRKTALIGSKNAEMILGADIVEKIHKINGVVDKYSQTGFDVLTVEQMNKILSDSRFMNGDLIALDMMLANGTRYAEQIEQNRKNIESNRALLSPYETILNGEKIFLQKLTDTKSVNKAIEAVNNSSIDVAIKNTILNTLQNMKALYNSIDDLNWYLTDYKNQFSSERLKIVADIDLFVEKAYTFAYEFGIKKGLDISEIPTKEYIEEVMRSPKGQKAAKYGERYAKYTAAVKSEFTLGRTLSFDGGRITIASGETAGIKFLSRSAVDSNQVGGFVTGGEMLFSSLGEVLQKSGFVITDDIISFEKGLNKIKHAFDASEQQKEANSGTYKAQKYNLSKVSAEELFDIMSKDPETSHLTLDDIRKLRRQYLEEVTKIKEKICSDVISADADYLYDSEVVIFIEQDGKIKLAPITYDEYNAWVDYRYANNILFTAAGLPEHKTIFDSSIDMNGQHYMALPTDASGRSNYYSLSLLEFLAGVNQSNAAVLSDMVNQINSPGSSTSTDVTYISNVVNHYSNLPAETKVIALNNPQVLKQLLQNKIDLDVSKEDLAKVILNQNDPASINAVADLMTQNKLIDTEFAQALIHQNYVANLSSTAKLTNPDLIRTIYENETVKAIRSIENAEFIYTMFTRLINNSSNSVDALYFMRMLTDSQSNALFAQLNGTWLQYDAAFEALKKIGNYSIYGADQAVNILDPNYAESYNRIVEYANERYNMPENVVNRLLSKVINVQAGACSYASLCNSIFIQFINNPAAFKSKFGFDMYETVNGTRVLNYRQLLFDIFVKSNIEGEGFKLNESDTKILTRNKDGQLVFNRVGWGPFSRLADSREQVYASWKAVSDYYFGSYGIEQSKFDISNDMLSSLDLSIEQHRRFLKEQIEFLMSSGYSIELYEERVAGSPINFICVDDPNYSLSTNNWREGDSHITAVVDVDNDGIYIVSWGRKYYVRFEDLKYGNYGIDAIKLNW